MGVSSPEKEKIYVYLTNITMLWSFVTRTI